MMIFIHSLRFDRASATRHQKMMIMFPSIYDPISLLLVPSLPPHLRMKFILIILNNAKNNTSLRLNLPPLSCKDSFFLLLWRNKNHVFSTFTVSLKALSVVYFLLRFFFGCFTRNNSKKRIEITTNWRCASSEKCLRVSLCYYLIFSLSRHLLLLPLLIQISRGFCVHAGRRKTSKKNCKKRQKNNEKRHNYMHA